MYESPAEIWWASSLEVGPSVIRKKKLELKLILNIRSSGGIKPLSTKPDENLGC